MSEYIIKNGHVFDPTQGIKGDKKDIAVKDDKIVDKVGSSAKVIDASGKTVMAGALEVHAHVAGPKVNAGRWYRPEDKHFDSHKTPGITRIEGGKSIPTVFKTGYEYARMGFTFAMEAAMPPLYARHVHEEIHDTPIIDEAALPVFGNNWFILEYLKNQEIANTAAYIAWILRQTKGYGVKCVNPGGTEAWAWGLNCLTIHDPVPYFDITPGEIIKGLIDANEYLGLPHSMHLHQNDLGNPGNYKTTIDSLKLAEGIKAKNNFGREQVLHSTHLQFHSYKGTNWGDFESGAKEVMDYVNKQKNLTIDTGNVTLDETTTMTADGPFEHHLHGLNHLKWFNVDVELETAAGIVPFIYDPSNAVFCSQWAVGLEIPLYAKDPMRCFITTDHPNAGPFTRYPRVYSWLMSKKTRDALLNGFKKADKVIGATNLANMDREITLYELAAMTRAGPAKALGLMKDYGGLAPGMNADIAIYNIN
ncbi:MAG: formylmethanofuran dehydrogenase subunit A, partial [Methanoregula sp.]|uniref:formylmethanofuran dehydrogenase subunit A n=1 Tax=Methanoregula sp. TaxID=2052170 RepID=UPI003C3992CE